MLDFETDFDFCVAVSGGASSSVVMKVKSIGELGGLF